MLKVPAGTRDRILAREKVCGTISKIYGAKIRADAWADDQASKMKGRKRGRKGQQQFGKKLRFDAFVLRWFQQLYGGVSARRHLRDFVVGAQCSLSPPSNPPSANADRTPFRWYLVLQESCQVHASVCPRIVLFSKMAGISVMNDNTPYNPRMSKFFFLPGLKALFPDPKAIEVTLGTGEEPVLVPRYRFILACVQNVAHGQFQGSRVILGPL